MKNFAGYTPYLESLTGYELTTDVKPGQINSNNIFKSNHQFFKNFNNKNMFKNAGGSWFDKYIGVNLGDALKYGGEYYTNQQQLDLAQQTEDIKAKELAIQKAIAEQEKLKLEQAKLKGGFIKSYGTPIAIGGAVIILGIATYFFFKKKKIN